MILSFRDGATEDVFCGRNSARARKFGALLGRAKIALQMVNSAETLEDLNTPGFKLELLTKELRGYYSIRVNKSCRVVFRFESSNAHDVWLSDHYRNN